VADGRGLDRPRLDRAALVQWLVSRRVVAPDGSVAAWCGPGAFAYPEAGGFVLRLLAGERTAHASAETIAGWLARAVLADEVGRAGRRHAFDLGIVLAGLAHHFARAPSGLVGEALAVGGPRLADAIEAARAHDGPRSDRWSARFGPHLRRVATWLAVAEALALPGDHERTRERLWTATGGESFDAQAPTPGCSATYLHACLYALEGSLVLAPRFGGQERVQRAAVWLASLQRPDGGMPAWADGARGFGPTRADATAQAVRLWGRIDRERFRVPIARGLDWLSRAAAPGGGVRYADDCDHENTWVTVFAIEALDDCEGGVDSGPTP
jgi:hypothetical protein